MSVEEDHSTVCRLLDAEVVDMAAKKALQQTNNNMGSRGVVSHKKKKKYITTTLATTNPKTFWIKNILDPEQLENHENIKIKHKTMKTLVSPDIKMLWI